MWSERTFWDSFVRGFLIYNGVYSVLEIMRIVKGCQRVGSGAELFYSDKDVWKKMKNLSHMLGKLYEAIY